MPSILNVCFCLQPRPRGHSALFDSFHYISTQKPSWEHTLVGWTGEVPSDVSLSLQGRLDYEDHISTLHTSDICAVWLPDHVDKAKDIYDFRDQGRWRRFAEHELYPLFHYTQHEPNDGRREQARWADYAQMNATFADRIVQIYKPGDVIWIHDYHLMLLPEMLRERIPYARLGFFLHIPFPSTELIRCSSRKNALLKGILGADLIGFQTKSYAEHFKSSCQRILGLDASSDCVGVNGRQINVKAFHTGIAAMSTEHFAFTDHGVQKHVEELRRTFAGKKLIIGRDRLDSVKGIPHKLRAFEKFLERHPQWQGRVILIQIVNPTVIEEESDDDRGKLANKVAELVARINGKYGSLSFLPVNYYPQYVSKEEYYALLRISDIGLITSIRDSMNTTALEYVVCQKDNYGSLLLSEFSASSESLNSAHLINPWHSEAVADRLHEALGGGGHEQRAEQVRLYDHVKANEIRKWTDQYLEHLTNLSTGSTAAMNTGTPLLDVESLIKKYWPAKKRLFLFDYDGTLAPIVTDPDSAIPSAMALENVRYLASDPSNAVWIISGRDQAFLAKWLDTIPGLGLSAEHGNFIRYPSEIAWENASERMDMAWQDEVQRIFQTFTDATPGSFIETKRVALTWHYRLSEVDYGKAQANECRNVVRAMVCSKWDLEVMEGKANVEVRPRTANKGAIVRRLLNESSGTSVNGISQNGSHFGTDFIFCAGDDSTDEDMFSALETPRINQDSSFTCLVGPSSKPTLARWHVPEPSDVLAAIEAIRKSVEAVRNGAQEFEDAIPRGIRS